MNQEFIEQIRRYKKLPLTGNQKIKHYYIVILPLIPVIFLLYDRIGHNIAIGYGIWFFIVLSFLFYIIQRRKLKFKGYKGNFSREELNEAIERTSNELEWQIEINNENIIQAFRNDLIEPRSGDLITIVTVGDNAFLINNISDPRKITIPLISLTKKENVRTLLKHLNDVIQKQPENKDYLIPSKEWTPKRIITRIILYPFWLFVIIMSVILITNPIHYKSIGAGIGGLFFGIGYFIIDIKLILKRKKYESTTRLQK